MSNHITILKVLIQILGDSFISSNISSFNILHFEKSECSTETKNVLEIIKNSGSENIFLKLLGDYFSSIFYNISNVTRN